MSFQLNQGADGASPAATADATAIAGLALQAPMNGTGRPLHVLVAPSGYKENLCSEEVAVAISEGIRAACPNVRITELPLVDGGEGTAATLARLTGGTMHTVTVTGPVGEPIEASFALLGAVDEPTAVIELAAAAGLGKVPRDRRDPTRTTTRGVGEMIIAALDIGVRKIVIGCGDSGVNDGGAGLCAALGAQLLDAGGSPIADGGGALEDLDRIDLSGLDPRLRSCSIDVACNIKNVLCGSRGVARVFAPQKGATPEQAEALAVALDHYAAIIERDIGIDVRQMPGGGASGGVGAGLHAMLGASLTTRFDVLLPYFPLDEALATVDLVVTAEGGLDAKSARGKIPAEIGDRAKALGVPVIVLAGTIGDDATVVRDHGVTAYFSTVSGPETLEYAMENASAEISRTAENVIRVMLTGMAFRERQPLLG